MNATVNDLMVATPITTHQHATIGHVKEIMAKNKIHSIPIVNDSDEVQGIVTSNDLVDDIAPETPVRQIMTRKVLTIPQYNKVHIAARIMRNHHIHHLVVTHEKKIVGVISAFDLLALVENHRFVSKNPPTRSRKKVKRS